MAHRPIACDPVRTLAELNDWAPPESALDELKRSTVPLTQGPTTSKSSKQSMLVCHDMAGPLPDTNRIWL